MPGILESLAGGLRSAGGIISPSTFKVVAEEDQAQAAERRRMELMQLQETMAATKEKMLSDAVAPALSKGDFEGAASAAAKSGAPGSAKMAMDLLGKAEERKQRALQAFQQLDMRQQALDQQKELALQRASDAKERDAINATFKAQGLALQETNQRLMAGFKQQGLDLQAERQRQQDQQKLNTNTQKLSASLEKAGLPESDAVLGAVETALDKRPDIAEFISGPKSWIPDAALPNDVAAGRQAFQKLFNITLKNRSGSAVTNQELDRLKQEFATGVFKTPDQLRTAVAQARNIINKHYASVASGFGKDVLESYNENVRGFGGRVVLEAGDKTEDPLGIR